VSPIGRRPPDECLQRENVASYVLGAMPDDEQAAFVSHLDACPTCPREIADLQVVADTLPLAAPQLVPPPELKNRVMTVVRSEAQLLRAAGPEADRPATAARPERRHRVRRAVLSLRPLPAAALASVLLALGVGGGVLLSAGDEEAAPRTVPAQVTVAGAPDARAELVISEDGTRLQVRNLPTPPRGRVYQVWTQRAQEAPDPTTSLFSVNADGAATVAVPGDLDKVDNVLVSAEPPSGSQVPTTQPVIIAKAS
jgi:Anti-sigma-K factor rskA/Putative zinc-finger